MATDENFISSVLHFLTINDVYDIVPNDTIGGLASLMTLLKQERAAIVSRNSSQQRSSSSSHTFTTINGDFLSASAMAQRLKGVHMIELLNFLEIDMAVLGNHEFDFGPDVLKDRMKQSRFSWLGSNVMEIKSAKKKKEEKTMDDVNTDNGTATDITEDDGLHLFEHVTHTFTHECPKTKIKFGFFGLVTADTPNISYPGPTVTFLSVVDTAQICVKELKNQDVDVIIALTHLSIAQDKLVARKVQGIDLIMGGHDHQPFTIFEGGTMIHKSGQNALWLGHVELHVRKNVSSGVVNVYPSWKMIHNHNIPPDAEVQAIVDKYLNEVKTTDSDLDLTRFLATNLTEQLDTRYHTVRNGTSQFGHMVADALRITFKTDFGLINGGFIRGDKIYEKKCNFTVGMIHDEMPFPRPAVIISIKGKDLKSALEEHLRYYPALSGGHPHLSGLSITYQPAPPLITSITTTEMDAPFDLEAIYSVATSSFIADGGDGNNSWKKGTLLSISNDSIATNVINYLSLSRMIQYDQTDVRCKILD